MPVSGADVSLLPNTLCILHTISTKYLVRIHHGVFWTIFGIFGWLFVVAF